MPNPHGKATRAVLILGALLIALGVIGVVVFRTMGPGRGGLHDAADRLEDWIGAQIVGIANSYLVPQLDYADIDYQAPGTVTLDGVTLTAPDGTDVIALDGMVVTLAEVPRIGQPIKISTLSLDAPTINLIREIGPDGAPGFRGLTPIVKATPVKDEQVEPNFRLSNVLQLQTIEITEGAFRYDPSDGSPPMTITGLTTTVNASPDQTEPGFYDLDIQTRLGPLLDLTLQGALSLDTYFARVGALRLHGRLDPTSAGALPPQLQQLVAQYDAQGQIDVNASGALPLTDPLAGELSFSANLTNFRVASGDYQLPIDTVALSGSLAGGSLTLPSLTADLLQGRLTASADAALAQTAIPAQLNWRIEGFDLQDLLRTNVQAEGPPRLAGRLNASGALTTTLADPRAGLDGSGQVQIRDGSVLILPGLTELASVMNVAVRRAAEPRHQVDAAFDLGPAGVQITSSEVITEFLAARAKGTIDFDQTLDLSVNAGPMEKLQSLLGKVGDVLGNVTDRLVTYRVRGTIQDPTVSVAPLGVGG